jgi:hypothetical protein
MEVIMKRILLTILLFVSGLSGMTRDQLNHMPKKAILEFAAAINGNASELRRLSLAKLIERTLELQEGRDIKIVENKMIEAHSAPKFIQIQPKKEIKTVHTKKPNALRMNKVKLASALTVIGLGTAAYLGYQNPEVFHAAVDYAKLGFDIVKTAISSSLIPLANVKVCKTTENFGFWKNLVYGPSTTVCKSAKDMSFKELFYAFFK